MNNNKGSAALMAILIAMGVILIGGGIWYISSKSSNIQPSNTSDLPISNTATSTLSNDTANWKTYSNSQYGFEVEYPSTWKVQETEGAGIWINPPYFVMPQNGTVNPYFSFFVSAHSSPAIDEKPITRAFGTRTGYIYTKAQSVFFPFSDRVGAYVIQLYTPSGVNEPNQILSSLKFIN